MTKRPPELSVRTRNILSQDGLARSSQVLTLGAGGQRLHRVRKTETAYSEVLFVKMKKTCIM